MTEGSGRTGGVPRSKNYIRQKNESCLRKVENRIHNLMRTYMLVNHQLLEPLLKIQNFKCKIKNEEIKIKIGRRKTHV